VVRIAGGRFRVVGVMEPKGQMMGFDIDDIAIVPVATALRLFNQDELFEIDLVYANAAETARVEAEVKRVLTLRHGDEDFTVTTQEAMLDVFGNVMGVVTMAVGAIAGISLLVGATGILTMMWIAVGERTSEIGLLRALGASRTHVLTVFLAEAVALATLGGVAGIAIGLGLGALARLLVPGLPVETPVQFVLAGLFTSFAAGVVAGVAPARRAARLDPLEALRAE
jgi:putative ABC transport system permease protein